MNNKTTLDIYNEKIMPKIKEIDLFLKTTDEISKEKTANILDISLSELDEILKKLNISTISVDNFLHIMINGSSFICKILKREIECGSPYFYTPKDLSYIYNLDYQKVLDAYNFLELKTITTNQIPAILVQI